MATAESKATAKDHQRLKHNLELIQKTYTVAELSVVLDISINAWTNRMKEPWRKFSYDDLRAIAQYCRIDFVKLVDGELKIGYFGEEYEPRERAARDKNGNRIRVPADMTYKDWYKKYIENGTQSAQTSARGNNTPKPSGKPQQTPESVPATVDVPTPKVNKPEYTDTPIPPKINNQSIDNSVQNDIIESELRMSADSGFTLKEKHYNVIENTEQVAAAEKYAKEVLSVGNLKLSGLKNGEVIQPMLERLAILKETHNKCFSQIIVDSTMLGTDFAMVAPDLSLHLNAKYMNSPEATADFLSRMKELKLLPKGLENTDYIITHEYMHFISRSEVDNLRSR